MTRREADCVIVGGGIGGAVLALALGRKGRRVVVLERETRPLPAGRPEVLAGATLEIFDSLGVGSRIREQAALPIRGLEAWRAGRDRLLALTEEDIREAGAAPHSTDPGLTRQLLMEAAEAAVEVVRGVEVRELITDGSRVIGVRGVRGGEAISVNARLVVGDDGPHSKVREGLGIALPATNFALDFLAAAGPALPGLRNDIGEAWIDPWGVRRGLPAALFLPLPGARTAMVFLLSPGAYRRFSKLDPQVFHRAAVRLTPRAAELDSVHKFPEGFAHITRPFGHAQRYVADGAALLGDAAHPVTPAGGQGANMSAADAAVLTEVADAALARGDCGADALRSYESIRRPANERSLRFSSRTHNVLRLLQVMPLMAPLLPLGLGMVDRRPALRQRFIRSIAEAFRSDRSATRADTCASAR